MSIPWSPVTSGYYGDSIRIAARVPVGSATIDMARAWNISSIVIRGSGLILAHSSIDGVSWTNIINCDPTNITGYGGSAGGAAPPVYHVGNMAENEAVPYPLTDLPRMRFIRVWGVTDGYLTTVQAWSDFPSSQPDALTH